MNALELLEIIGVCSEGFVPVDGIVMVSPVEEIVIVVPDVGLSVEELPGVIGVVEEPICNESNVTTMLGS